LKNKTRDVLKYANEQLLPQKKKKKTKSKGGRRCEERA
jgi:hypothetical protein